MTKKEIFDIEQTNRDKIYLYKEGMFWIAYERSAYRFANYIRPYRATKKMINSIALEMVSLGFPVALLDSLDVEILDRGDKQAILKAPDPNQPNEREFEAWKDAIALHQPKPQNPETPKPNPQQPLPQLEITQIPSLADRLRDFNLANKTPMECMMFILELKNSLGDEI